MKGIFPFVLRCGPQFPRIILWFIVPFALLSWLKRLILSTVVQSAGGNGIVSRISNGFIFSRGYGRRDLRDE